MEDAVTARTKLRPRVPAPGVTVDRDVMVLMRDGVRVACDIYRPDDIAKHPALYAVSPYQKDLAGLPAYPVFPYRETGPIEWYVQQGYIYVLADSRGTGKSVEGEWSYLDVAEQHDLFDTIEWIASQQWCTGRVGMIGQSYLGVVQWAAGIQNPPHLACIAPYDARVDHYRDAVYHGGVPALGYPSSWSFGLRYNHEYGPPGRGSSARLKTDLMSATLEHPLDDEFWRIRSPYWRMTDCKVPALSIGSWGKNSLHLRGNILGWELVGGPRKLLVEEAGEPVRLGVVRAQRDFDSPEFHKRVLLPWYDHWLKGVDNGVCDGPPVTVYMSGVDRSVSFKSWPPDESAYVAYFLQGSGSSYPRSLNSGRLTLSPSAGEPEVSSYSYPQQEWHSGSVEILPGGGADVFGRTLTWSTDVLAQDLTVAGNVECILYLRSTEDDADVFLKLWDVTDDGFRKLISRGWLRASHRAVDEARSTVGRPFHGHDSEVPIPEGQFVELRVEVWPAAHCFRAGHRVCLQVVNTDSPLTDANYTHYYGLKAGTDDIAHTLTMRSRLILPVIANT